jgi:CDP-glucose 4,6-dehydratase
MGAEVMGYALQPPTTPNLFQQAGVGDGMESTIADIRDLEQLGASLRAFQPEFVFHLAAQPLVRRSYSEPVETYATNVMGTVNLLEAVRGVGSVRAVVNVTSDKCYENREWVWGYRENEPMGGYDPYSSSKGCAELVTSAYRRSFFSSRPEQGATVAIATARAGNVIGGGDWAEDRLIPDIMKAFAADQVVNIRSPAATRPWQHVLEPVRGYLMLAECLGKGECSEGWNFGPADADVRPVKWVTERLREQWGGGTVKYAVQDPDLHEAALLKLDSSKAMTKLGWIPRWKLEEALSNTAAWYKAWASGEDLGQITRAQIDAYLG